MLFDTTFDVRSDAKGRDPDAYSPTLRAYHKFLWSKPLPDGRSFELSDTTPRAYLHHRSNVGEFWLASDSVAQTFSRWPTLQPIVKEVEPEWIDRFVYITSTVGGLDLERAGDRDRDVVG